MKKIAELSGRCVAAGARLALIATAMMVCGFADPDGAQPIDREAWLADLRQMRTAIDRDYPNLEWLNGQRDVSLDRWFDRTATAIRTSHDDADARRALDALIERFNDGHLMLIWPSADRTENQIASDASPPPEMTAAAFCGARGYDAGQVTLGTAAALPGYRAIDGGGPFGAGLVDSDGKRIGVVRIGVFAPEGYPKVCEQALINAAIPIDQPCDETCEDRLKTEAYALLTRGLIATVERLQAAGAELLMIDLSRNGGGTEWAEAAARIVSPVSLRSAPTRVIRGQAWVHRWRELADTLREEARQASRNDRTMLLDLAQRASDVADGLKPCSGVACSRLAQAGFGSGMIAELPAPQLQDRTWGPLVFSPAQFPYRDGVWAGPVIVLVDDETWSAAEEFAALLRDNDAAIVMGTRTGGAGCGHLYENQPTRLAHSGARLVMPNCARFRKDGENEVGGIVPDIATGVRWNDGAAYAAKLTAARLSDAIDQSYALVRGRGK